MASDSYASNNTIPGKRLLWLVQKCSLLESGEQIAQIRMDRILRLYIFSQDMFEFTIEVFCSKKNIPTDLATGTCF